jgi:hypothetical protein
MIWVFWRGKGYWVIFILAAAMFAPMIGLRQIDGPEIDYGVGIAMGLAAIVTFIAGYRLNRRTPKGEPAGHSFWGLPFQYWAVPMLIFGGLLGTRTITTEETPRSPPATYALQTDLSPQVA